MLQRLSIKLRDEVTCVRVLLFSINEMQRIREFKHLRCITLPYKKGREIFLTIAENHAWNVAKTSILLDKYFSLDAMGLNLVLRV